MDESALLVEDRINVLNEKISVIIELNVLSVDKDVKIELSVPTEAKAIAIDLNFAVEVTSMLSMVEMLADLVSNIIGELIGSD